MKTIAIGSIAMALLAAQLLDIGNKAGASYRPLEEDQTKLFTGAGNDKICASTVCGAVGAGPCRRCTGSMPVGRCVSMDGQCCDEGGGTICGYIEKCVFEILHAQSCQQETGDCTWQFCTQQGPCDTSDCQV